MIALIFERPVRRTVCTCEIVARVEYVRPVAIRLVPRIVYDAYYVY